MLLNNQLEVSLIDLPKNRFGKVLQLTHERLGHVGYRKVVQMITQAMRHCKSCPSCQKCNNQGARKAPKVARSVNTESFEQLAVDIVGAPPIGKGGRRYLLNSV